MGRFRGRLRALLWYRFARPGVIAAASLHVPPKLRTAAPRPSTFDLYMNSAGVAGQADDGAGDDRLGAPDLLPGRRLRRLSQALDGAQRALRRATRRHRGTANNAQYRGNVLLFAKTLRELGARRSSLISSTPYTEGDAGSGARGFPDADLVQEVFFSGRLIHRQGAVAGSRTVRTRFRQAVRTFTDIGSRRAASGSCSGFQASTAAPCHRSPGSSTSSSEALAAKQVARDAKIGTVWWWAGRPGTRPRPIRTRRSAPASGSGRGNPRPCAGPEAAGPDFDKTLGQGQMTLRGVRCAVGDQAIGWTQAFAGSRGSSATAGARLGRLLAGRSREARGHSASGRDPSRPAGDHPVALPEPSRVPEGTRPSRRDRGRGAGIIADELRQQRMRPAVRAPNPTGQQIAEYHGLRRAARADGRGEAARRSGSASVGRPARSVDSRRRRCSASAGRGQDPDGGRRLRGEGARRDHAARRLPRRHRAQLSWSPRSARPTAPSCSSAGSSRR